MSHFAYLLLLGIVCAQIIHVFSLTAEEKAKFASDVKVRFTTFKMY